MFESCFVLGVFFVTITANNALGRLRNLALYGHSHIPGNVGIRQHLIHVEQRIPPGFDLLGGSALVQLLAESFENNLLNFPTEHIFLKVCLDRLVNDHSSSYFFAVPRALSAGYFSALRATL